jgi:hypothetical protein
MKDTAMVAIKMTRNSRGSPDGHSVKHYAEGEEYDVPESLAKDFVETDKVAEYVTEKVAEKADKPTKNKVEKVAENKAV